MKILVTGADGFVGKNLIQNLLNVQSGNGHARAFSIDHLFQINHNSSEEELAFACSQAEFVFNLAGVNRSSHAGEFMEGNYGFAVKLLRNLKKADNHCPIMLASSIQASLIGRYQDSDYGHSKLRGEELFFRYGKDQHVKVLVYRFPNLFGKWGRSNYNSVVATFCDKIANNQPIKVNDANTELDLAYIDDVVEEMFEALEGHEHRCDFQGVNPIENAEGRYCFVPKSYHESLGTIVSLLENFAKEPSTLEMPSMANGTFAKKLYSTYLSYLPESKIAFTPIMHTDFRGSFTELLRTDDHGQVSINISKPGITKGQHWHNTKWEQFVVVSGHGLIQERKVGDNKIINIEVSGKNIKIVHMLPGYIHNIINLSDVEDLVTVMWANETFTPKIPDTYHAAVDNYKEDNIGQ